MGKVTFTTKSLVDEHQTQWLIKPSLEQSLIHHYIVDDFQASLLAKPASSSESVESILRAL